MLARVPRRRFVRARLTPKCYSPNVIRNVRSDPFLTATAMTNKTIVKPRTAVRTKTQRPPLYKVILLNDDYTPREFVVLVLKAVFRMNEDQAYRVMMTAHQRGACVIAVFTRDVAETKAKEATELGKSKGYPLFFTTEPEE